MIRRPHGVTLNDNLFPYTTVCLSPRGYDGDRVVRQDVAVDRAHRERGGQGDVHDAVGQVVDHRRQRDTAHRFMLRVLPAAAMPDQNTGNSRSVVASTSTVPVPVLTRDRSPTTVTAPNRAAAVTSPSMSRSEEHTSELQSLMRI